MIPNSLLEMIILLIIFIVFYILKLVFDSNILYHTAMARKNNVNFGWFGAAAGSAIFNLIRRKGPISRAKLVKLTSLSKSTVSMHVEKLLRMGLIKEQAIDGSEDSGKRRKIKVDEESGYIFGIQFGITSINISLCNMEAEIIEFKSLNLHISSGPENLLPEVYTVMDELLNNNKINKTKIFSIGIGLPGPVKFDQGVVISPPIMPGWDNYPVMNEISEKYNCSVFVDNDVNVMAIGEMNAGHGRYADNFIFVKVGTGIGAGIIINNRIYRGTRGSAGDIGHIGVEGESVLCPCGNRGCLEMIAGGGALGKMGLEIAKNGSSSTLSELLKEYGDITAKEVGMAAAQGDVSALEIIIRSGKEIGKVLSKLVNFFNPAMIIIGGGVSNIGELFLRNIREEIYSRSTSLATSELVIKKSYFGDKTGMIGAAEMCLEEFFSHDEVTRMVQEFPITK